MVRNHIGRYTMNADHLSLAQCSAVLDTGDIVMIADQARNMTADFAVLLSQGSQELPFVHLAIVFKDTLDWFGNGQNELYILEWRLVGNWKILPFKRRMKKLLNGHAVVRRLQHRTLDYARMRRFFQDVGLFAPPKTSCNYTAFFSSVISRFVLKIPFQSNTRANNCTDALLQFMQTTQIVDGPIPTSLSINAYDCFYKQKLFDTIMLTRPLCIDTDF